MLVQQIDPTIIIAIIGLIGAVVPVGITYVLTKRKEIDASIRQQKTDRYDVLIGAILMVLDDVARINAGRADSIDYDTIKKFINAYNRASAYASDLVLKRCSDFTPVIFLQPRSDPKEVKIIDFDLVRYHIKGIFKAIRLDINPKAKYSDVAVMWYTEDDVKYH